MPQRQKEEAMIGDIQYVSEEIVAFVEASKDSVPLSEISQTIPASQMVINLSIGQLIRHERIRLIQVNSEHYIQTIKPTAAAEGFSRKKRLQQAMS